MPEFDAHRNCYNIQQAPSVSNCDVRQNEVTLRWDEQKTARPIDTSFCPVSHVC